MLKWERRESPAYPDQKDYFAELPDGRTLVACKYGAGDWGAGWVNSEDPTRFYLGVRYDLPTLRDAKLAGEVLAVGGDPKLHAFRVSTRRQGGMIRGSQIALSKFYCSTCDAQTCGSDDAAGAREGGWEHWRTKMQEQIDGASSS